MVGLLPSSVSRNLSIENSNWFSNKRKDETIQLDISNKHFYDTIKIKKSITSIYFFNQSKKFKTNCFSLTIPHKKDMEGKFMQISQELRHR